MPERVVNGVVPFLLVALLAGCGSGPSPASSAASTPPFPPASSPSPTLSPAPPQATMASTSPSSGTNSSPPAGGPAASGPAHFKTVPPGSALPSGSQCAQWVRARPVRENKGVNTPYNKVTGQRIDPALFSGDDRLAAQRIAPRIDGAFTGTTGQILRWAACKWGIDEDLVYAQAAIESWWRQDTKGDYGTDAAACPPGHALGADGQAGKCPQSYGILQNRYPYMTSAWPKAETSTAMNADLAYGIFRICFEGYETWLNTVERGRQYGAGDVWGCVGRWFSGRWHVAAGEDYVNRVKDYLDRRIWTTPDFQQP